MKARSAVRLGVALVAAVLVTAVAGSIVQTQINLAAITRLGVAVPVQTRLATTAEDVVRFGPVMASVALAAFVPALAAAWAIGRAWHRRLFGVAAALAGAAGLWAAFVALGFVTPMPTLVAAVRTPSGLAAMCATGLLGGLVFASLASPPRART